MPHAFGFTVAGSNADFRVLEFRGTDAISEIFQFEIDLACSEKDLDLESVLNRSARLEIDSGGQSSYFQGIVCSFEQADETAYSARYNAILVPSLWLLTLNMRSQIYQNTTVPEMIKEVLKEHGLAEGRDYTVALTREYVRREYVVQYQETDFNFVSRWLEHEGIYYFFSDGKLILADNSSRSRPIRSNPVVPYRPESGLESASESVHNVVVRQQLVPRDVLLKDYNWRKPALSLKVESSSGSGGSGRTMEYGDHFKEEKEGKHLAELRNQEIKCRQRIIEGRGDCIGFQAGLHFSLADHSNKKLNREYLLTEVQHMGSQTGVAAAETEDAISAGMRGGSYSNQFWCIPSNVPYRPLRKSPKPRVFGTMNAKIDATGSGKYAEVDDQGRYKVVMPFDLSGREGGKASRYMRMAQPYSGPNYGIHFPLHKNAEVIWSGIDGDPDRPIICGAVPNPKNASPVNNSNHTQSVVRDYAGNEIVLEGAESRERIRIHCPGHNSTITLGASITAATDNEVVITSEESHILVEGKTRITVKVGSSTIDMYADGKITLEGREVSIIGSEKIVLAAGGSTVQLDTSGIKETAVMIRLNS